MPLHKGNVLVVLSGLLWGISTQLMKQQSHTLVHVYQRNCRFFTNVVNVLTNLALNWKFIACFGLNQLGSILYTISLSYNPLTVVVPISNSINLAVIVLLDCYKGNVNFSAKTVLGVVSIFMGVTLCMLSPRSQ